MSSTKLAELFVEQFPTEAGSVLREQPQAALAEFVNALAVDRCVDLLSEIPPSIAGICLSHLSGERTVTFLESVSPTIATSVLRDLPRDIRAKMLHEVRLVRRRDLRNRLRHPPHTVGAHMDSRPVLVRLGTSVRSALERVRSMSVPVEYVVLVDTTYDYRGVISVGHLMHSVDDRLVESIALSDVATLTARQELEDVVNHASFRKSSAMAVVNEIGKPIGIVRHEQLLAAHHEGAEEIRSPVDGDLLELGDDVFGVLSELLDLALAVEKKPSAAKRN